MIFLISCSSQAKESITNMIYVLMSGCRPTFSLLSPLQSDCVSAPNWLWLCSGSSYPQVKSFNTGCCQRAAGMWFSLKIPSRRLLQLPAQTLHIQSASLHNKLKLCRLECHFLNTVCRSDEEKKLQAVSKTPLHCKNCVFIGYKAAEIFSSSVCKISDNKLVEIKR